MPISISPGFMYIVQPLLHASASRRASFTYGVAYSGGEQAVIDQADMATKDTWDQNFDSQVTMLAAQGYYRTNSGDPLQTVTSAVANRAGTRVGSSQVSSVAVRVTKRTAFVGKRYRGRVYLPWILTEADVDEVGVLLPATVTTLQGHANNWLSSLAAAAAITAMHLGHNYTGAVDPELGDNQVTSLVVQPTVGTQRKRIAL